MTKVEAIKAMESGWKIHHRYFSTGEYIFLKEGEIESEDGYRISVKDFWHLRRNPMWQTDWDIFPEGDAQQTS
jgi:hypothetical protein